jgi:phosphohistidine phosphatase SixA
MGELVLIRHGQANSAANDEAGYDRLSELGHQQARWLGDWLRAHEAPFDRVLMGSLRRHRETAEAWATWAPSERSTRASMSWTTSTSPPPMPPIPARPNPIRRTSS